MSLDVEQLRAAAERAGRLYKAKGFRAAYVAGATAALIGRDRVDCPYPPGGHWRETYRAAWMHGFVSCALSDE